MFNMFLKCGVYLSATKRVKVYMDSDILLGKMKKKNFADVCAAEQSGILQCP
jgi:hypothetical protein